MIIPDGVRARAAAMKSMVGVASITRGTPVVSEAVEAGVKSSLAPSMEPQATRRLKTGR